MGQKLVSPATYWRRRVVALAVGLAVLTVLAWAANVGLSDLRTSGHGSPRADAGHVASSGARSGAVHKHRQTLAGQTADLGFQQRPEPPPSAPPSAASASPSPTPGRQSCAGAVTLTLRSAQSRYGSGQQVTFVVHAVSTRSRPCRVNLGTRFASVVVASGGTPIWDSSSCLRGSGSQVVTLKRGVPAVLRVSWDQRTSISGCPGKGSAARAGTYTAAVFDGQLRSANTSFVLSGQGAAVP